MTNLQKTILIIIATLVSLGAIAGSIYATNKIINTKVSDKVRRAVLVEQERLDKQVKTAVLG